ncbi:MAG: HAD-IC family P-type ATPase, partial [Thermoguttaceae bacterium]|nr:HAD-IC family P-type ATPase [Thermoguttaceae bacterium]
MNANGKLIETDEFSYLPHIGLTSRQVALMRQKYGVNALTPPVRRSWWLELINKFKDPTIEILLVAAFVSVAITAAERWGLGNNEASFLDSIGIVFAVMLATLVGFFSERKSAREFELLNKVKDDITVKVLRDGQIGTMSIAEIVAGDIVRIDPGDKVPADGVVIESMGLYIDQSMLTGESVPARKSNYALPIELSKLIETLKPGNDSFVSRGSMVADGYGLFLVTAVGDRTQMGQIAGALAQDDESKSQTPLTAKLSQLAKQISVVGISGAITIFAVMATVSIVKSGLLKKLESQPTTFAILATGAILGGILLTRYVLKPFFARMSMKVTSRFISVLVALPMIIAVFAIALGIWEIMLPGADQGGFGLLKQILLAFVVAVTIIVVAVPEGLPMMVTVSLAMNMMKMARQNCLVRKLVASETIGSATVICTDKTGTLTENRMIPVRVFAEGKRFDRDSFDQLTSESVWNPLVDSIAVNSQANLHVDVDSGTGVETVTGIGNPTECALLKFLHEHKIDYLKERERFARKYEVGHNSQRKMSVVVAQSTADSSETCYLKGAPERVLTQCSTIWINGHAEPIEPWRDKIDAELNAASSDALRVLAFSQRVCTDPLCPGQKENDPAQCLACSNRCFLGLVGIADPVRPEVAQAAKMC